MFFHFFRYQALNQMRKTLKSLQKQFFFILLLMLVLLLQGCIEIVEKIDVNHDRSGSVNLSVSVMQGNFLLSLIKLGVDMDVLSEVEDLAEDAAATLRSSPGISNVQVTGSNKRGMVSLSFDFDNQRNLNRALYRVAGQDKTMFLPAVYKIRNGSFEKKNMTKLIELVVKEEQLELSPSLINYTTEVHLPRPAKSVSGKKAALYQNGQSVRVSANLADILENSTNTGLKVRY